MKYLITIIITIFIMVGNAYGGPAPLSSPVDLSSAEQARFDKAVFSYSNCVQKNVKKYSEDMDGLMKTRDVEDKVNSENLSSAEYITSISVMECSLRLGIIRYLLTGFGVNGKELKTALVMLRDKQHEQGIDKFRE